MKIISTNVGSPTTIYWKGKTEQTGIFKYPTKKPLFLGATDVANDTVMDRKHHAGIFKACYLFAANNYGFWKSKYPDLEWTWGMFGENLTVDGLDETVIRIGNIYAVGKAVIQISQPREPCYKLGIRFDDQKIVAKFIAHGRPGTYVKVIKEGNVKKGDMLELLEESPNPLTILDFYRLVTQKEKPRELLHLFMENEAVPPYKKDKLQKYLVEG